MREEQNPLAGAHGMGDSDFTAIPEGRGGPKVGGGARGRKCHSLDGGVILDRVVSGTPPPSRNFDPRPPRGEWQHPSAGAHGMMGVGNQPPRGRGTILVRARMEWGFGS